MKFKALANFFNFLSFKKEIKKNCNNHFHYSTQKHDDLITRYIPFLKGNSQKIRMLCLYNAWEILKLMSALYS